MIVYDKKLAALTLVRDAQCRFLTGNLPELLDSCMPLAMYGTNTVCKCMDGRAIVGRHLAGSGILLWHRLGERRALEIMGAMSLSGIATHEDCGAMKIVVRERGLSEDPDDLAEWWRNHVSNTLSIRNFGHSPVRYDFHPETVVVVDGTGRGHWTSTGLPDRMVVNAKYPDPEYISEELCIALRIIFGSSGMGELLSPDFPLIVLAVGDPRPGGRMAEWVSGLAKKVIAELELSDRTVVLPYTPPIETFPGR